MPNLKLLYLLIFILCYGTCRVCAQDSTRLDKLLSFPDKLLAAIQRKNDHIEAKLAKQTRKYLDKLARREQKLREKLNRTDSAKATALFGSSEVEYLRLKNKLEQNDKAPWKLSDVYSGHLDSLQTAVHFIDQSGLQNTTAGKLASSNFQTATLLQSYKSFQSRLNHTSDIKKYLDDRKQFLKTKLQNTPLAKEFNKYQKDLFYYKSQLEEYRTIFEHPEKLEAKLMQAVRAVPAFKQFFSKYSQLAELFPMPDNYGTAQGMVGLQTRNEIQSLIQDQVRSGGPNAQDVLSQNLSQAQTQLNTLKSRLEKFGKSGADLDMPDFKPNMQKTKSFFQRLEYATNVQTQKSGYFFPTTTDVALSAGYKLSEKSTIGLGASYKLGWGKDIRHIALSNQGIGFRSYADLKLKGSFYASGGFEYNYQQPFGSLEQIKNVQAWQRSGLAGISKIVSVKTKFFKKTKLQLLWDFLSYQQKPVGQPFKFRVGYNF